jgi:hypothetical protein
MAEPFDGHFNYRRVIGKLNYLEKSTRIVVTCATHQCARFVSKPKDVHGKAVKWIGRYFLCPIKKSPHYFIKSTF